MRRRLASALTLAVTLSVATACSSGGSSANAADGGAGGADSGPSPQVTAALTAYCDARAAFTTRCSASLNACESATSNACPATYAVYRDEYLNALVKCGFPTACDGYVSSEIEGTPCVADARDQIPTTPTMQKLATDLCAVCPASPGSDCLKDFFFHGRSSPDGSVTVSGIGSTFDTFTEALVAKISAACLPTASSMMCLPTFYSCVDQQRAALQPAAVTSACAVGGAIGP